MNGMNSVKVLFGHDVHSKLLDDVSDISKIVDDGLKISRMHDGSYLPSYDFYRLLETYYPEKKSIVLGFLREACKKAEMIGPFSSAALVKLLYEILKYASTSNDAPQKIISDIEESLEDIIDKIPNYSNPPSEENFKKILSSLIRNDELVYIILESVKLAGSSCKIFIEKTLAQHSIIEKIDGYTFNLSPNHSFYKSETWKHEDVKVFLIDGIVQNVSEIDSILHTCHQRKQPIAIFARGFDKDVISTIYANHLRGVLKIIPIEVAFDVKTVNVLNDIAVVINGDVISSLKGELISTVSFDDLPTVKNIECRGNSVVIRNQENKERINQHIHYLREKRDNETFDNVKSILDERIKSLSSSSVMIKLSFNSTADLMQKIQKVDIGLRSINSMILYGGLESENFNYQSKNMILNNAINSLGSWSLPTLSFIAALKLGCSTALSILSTGAILSLESDASV